MSANGLVIKKDNVHKLTEADIRTFNSKEHWHKFVLENGGTFDKDAVLQAVLDSISPFDLVPVKYTVTGKDAYFLARNCGQAIEKLRLNSLSPIQLKDKAEEVSLSVEICHIPVEEFKVNMQFHLKKAIERRCDPSQKGFVDLSSFHKEPELYKILFCPLSRPKFLPYVLSILKRILPVTSINLSNNEIDNLKSLEILKDFEGLVSLDLSNNKIKDLDVAELLGKAVPKLQELILNGNPICSHFNTELEYVNWIRDKIPGVNIIDGVTINYNIPNQKIWLCSEKVWNIVDEFLKHYFTLYDVSRKSLQYAYDEKAIFSITCDENSKDSRLECYQHENKNLLRGKDKSKVLGVSHHRNTNIAVLLSKFPITQHDPYSFKVDVPYFQEQVIILFVSGIFKDFQDAPRVRSFNHTFVLNKVASNEYKITNDLYHVTNATDYEISNSFCHTNSIENQIKPKLLVNKTEEENLTKSVARLTKMNYDYSRRCLEVCNWDIRNALEVFLENYESFNIPPEAFTE